MKKFLTILTLVFLVAAFTSNSFAQKVKASEVYNSTIFVNPFGLIWGLIDVAYEQKLSDANSIKINGQYWNWGSGWTGFGIGGSYRWYLDVFKDNKVPLQGFSVGPRIDVFKWSWSSDIVGLSTYDGGVYVGIGGEAAYKWVFSGGWTVEPSFYLAIPISKVNGLGLNGYGLSVGLGYSWN
jgi:hypothetical protein